ncbi:hypothetical protein [Methanobrevibacter sp.]
MRQVEEEIKILARDEYGEELKAIEEENQQLKQENTKYKNKIEELRKIENLDSAKAKEIINSLLQL